MNTNKIIVISVFVVLAVSAVAYLSGSFQNSIDTTKVSVPAVSGDSTVSSNSTQSTPSSVSNSIPVPKPSTDTPTPTSVNTYTMVTVAQHTSTASCWIVVNSFVYDVTKWILRHPGGTRAIIGMCGKDATAVFTGQHGGQARPESELASFEIGTLSVQ